MRNSNCGRRPLDEGTAALVALSAAIASDDTGELIAAVDRAAEVGDAKSAEEVLLQSMVFLGFPATITAFEIWRRRTEPAARPPSAGNSTPWEAHRAAGEAVCRRVYGDKYAALRNHLRALHPDLDRLIVEHGYGVVLSRPVLSLQRRELCAVGILARAGRWPKQLAAHLRGALNAGASPAEIEAALDIALERAPHEVVRVARTAWNQVARLHGVNADHGQSGTKRNGSAGEGGDMREDATR